MPQQDPFEELNSLLSGRQTPQTDLGQNRDPMAELNSLLGGGSDAPSSPPKASTPPPEQRDPFSELQGLLGGDGAPAPTPVGERERGAVGTVVGGAESLLKGSAHMTAGLWELAGAITPGSADRPFISKEGGVNIFKFHHKAYQWISERQRDFADGLQGLPTQEFRNVKEEAEEEGSAISFSENMEPGAWKDAFKWLEDNIGVELSSFARAAKRDPVGASLYISDAVLQAAPSLAVTIGSGLMAGGATIPVRLAVMGMAGSALESGGNLSDLRFDPATGERRESSVTQDAIAIGGGVAAGFVEAVGAGAAVSMMKQMMVRSSLGDAAKDSFMRLVGKGMVDFVKTGSKEGSTEVLQELINDAAAKIGWDPEREFGKDWFTIFTSGFLLGGGAPIAGRNLPQPQIPTVEPTSTPRTEEGRGALPTPQEPGPSPAPAPRPADVPRPVKPQPKEGTVIETSKRMKEIEAQLPQLEKGSPEEVALLEEYAAAMQNQLFEAQPKEELTEAEIDERLRKEGFATPEEGVPERVIPSTERMKEIEAELLQIHEKARKKEGRTPRKREKALLEEYEQAMRDQLAEAPGSLPKPAAQPAKVKMMITQADKAGLRKLGYGNEQIKTLRPEDAQRILESGRPRPQIVSDVIGAQIDPEIDSLPVTGTVTQEGDFSVVELESGSVLKIGDTTNLPDDAGQRPFDARIVARGEGWFVQEPIKKTDKELDRDAVEMKARAAGYSVRAAAMIASIEKNRDGTIIQDPILADPTAATPDPHAPKTNEITETIAGQPGRRIMAPPAVTERNLDLEVEIENIMRGTQGEEAGVLRSMGFTQADLASLSRVLNLANENEKVVKGIATSYSNAILRGLHQDAELRAIDAVSGVAMTDEDIAGFFLRMSQLTVQHQDMLAAIMGMEERGDLAAAQHAKIVAESYHNSIEVLRAAIQATGTMSGRILRLLQDRLDAEALTASNVLTRYRVAKGAPANAQEQTKLMEVLDKAKEAEQDLARTEREIEALTDEEIKKAAQQVVAEQSKSVEQEAKIRKEREEIKRALNKGGFNLHSLIGLSPDTIWLLSRLAVNYIKSGSNTLEAVVADMRTAIPSLTERDVYEILQAQNPKAKKRVEAEHQKALRGLKYESRLMIRLENALQGILDAKRPRKPTDPKIKSLQKQLREFEKVLLQNERNAEKLDRALMKIRDLESQLSLPSMSVTDLQLAKNYLTDLRTITKTEEKFIEIHRKIQSGDHTPLPTKQRRPVSPLVREKQIKLLRARQELNALIEASKPLTYFDFRKQGAKPLSAMWKSSKEVGKELNSFMRTLMATADASFLGLQMLYLGIGHPIRFTQAGWNGIKAGLSKDHAAAIDLALQDPYDPMANLMKQMGLDITSAEVGPITKREEIFMSRLIQRAPKGLRMVLGALAGASWGGPVGAAFGAAGGLFAPQIARASDRAFVNSLNLMRAGLFKDMAAKVPGNETALRAYATYLNEMTGRAKINSGAAKVLSYAFFAPRFTVSLYKSPFTIARTLKRHPELRQAVARDLGTFLAAGATVLALAKAAGLEVGDDPRDSDFGKIVVGNTRIDIWAGRSQVARALTRMVVAGTDRYELTGKHLTEKQKKIDPLRFWADLAIYKTAPLPSLMSALLVGRDIVGEDVTAGQAAARSVTPLFLQDMLEAYKYGTGEFALSFVAPTGVRVSAYGGPLQSADVKKFLRRTDFQPRQPDFPERIERNKELKKALVDSFEDMFAQQVRMRKPLLESLPKERVKEHLQLFAAQARYNIMLKIGNVPEDVPTLWGIQKRNLQEQIRSEIR